MKAQFKCRKHVDEKFKRITMKPIEIESTIYTQIPKYAQVNQTFLFDQAMMAKVTKASMFPSSCVNRPETRYYTACDKEFGVL